MCLHICRWAGVCCLGALWGAAHSPNLLGKMCLVLFLIYTNRALAIVSKESFCQYSCHSVCSVPWGGDAPYCLTSWKTTTPRSHICYKQPGKQGQPEAPVSAPLRVVRTDTQALLLTLSFLDALTGDKRPCWAVCSQSLGFRLALNRSECEGTGARSPSCWWR